MFVLAANVSPPTNQDDPSGEKLGYNVYRPFV